MSGREVRICVVGDELAAGTGDPKALGWVGRVVARTQAPGTLSHHVLAVPGETTTALSARWEGEVDRRLAHSWTSTTASSSRFGRHDVAAGLSVARSRLNLANILDVAESRNLPTLVVGPPPGAHTDNARLGELSRAFADVTHRRRVTYVETFAPSRRTTSGTPGPRDAGDDLPPAQAGYGLMAWLVLHSGWHGWLGVPDA